MSLGGCHRCLIKFPMFCCHVWRYCLEMFLDRLLSSDAQFLCAWFQGNIVTLFHFCKELKAWAGNRSVVSFESIGNLILVNQKHSRVNLLWFQSISLCYINMINFCVTWYRLVEIFNSLTLLLFMVSTLPKLPGFVILFQLWLLLDICSCWMTTESCLFLKHKRQL